MAYLASAKDEASRKPNLHIIRSDQGDWIGLYRDGKLLREGHSIPEDEVLDALGIEYGYTVWDEEFNEHGGRCPDDLPEGL